MSAWFSNKIPTSLGMTSYLLTIITLVELFTSKIKETLNFVLIQLLTNIHVYLKYIWFKNIICVIYNRHTFLIYISEELKHFIYNIYIFSILLLKKIKCKSLLNIKIFLIVCPEFISSLEPLEGKLYFIMKQEFTFTSIIIVRN